MALNMLVLVVALLGLLACLLNRYARWALLLILPVLVWIVSISHVSDVRHHMVDIVQQDVAQQVPWVGKPGVKLRKVPASPSRPTPTTPAETEERPAWVEAPDGPVGDVQEMSVTCGPYETRALCEADLASEVARRFEAVAEAGHLGKPQSVRLPASEVAPALAQLVADRYWETRETSVGPMQILHARVVLNPQTKAWLTERLRAQKVLQRIGTVGMGMTAIFAVLAVVWAGLRLTQREGKPSGRPAAAVTLMLLPLLLVA